MTHNIDFNVPYVREIKITALYEANAFEVLKQIILV